MRGQAPLRPSLCYSRLVKKKKIFLELRLALLAPLMPFLGLMVFQLTQLGTQLIKLVKLTQFHSFMCPQLANVTSFMSDISVPDSDQPFTATWMWKALLCEWRKTTGQAGSPLRWRFGYKMNILGKPLKQDPCGFNSDGGASH